MKTIIIIITLYLMTEITVKGGHLSMFDVYIKFVTILYY